jgi:membrane-bound lytic murein transglycosylase MltF
MQTKKFTNLNRVDHLFDAFAEQTLADPVEARARMQEQGRDPDEVVRHGMALVSRLKGRAELAIARQKTRERYERAKQQVLQRLETIANPAQYLTDLLARRGETALQVNFRKAESLSNEELLDMIDEVELLYIFDELEKPDSSESK